MENNKELLDNFGKLLIRDVRDGALMASMKIVKRTTPNAIDLKRYAIFQDLTDLEKEAVCDILSETITDTLFRFFEMLEENEELMKLMLINNDKMINIAEISEKMGSEIACYDDGWIQRFSQIGRFVL